MTAEEMITPIIRYRSKGISNSGFHIESYSQPIDMPMSTPHLALNPHPMNGQTYSRVQLKNPPEVLRTQRRRRGPY